MEPLSIGPRWVEVDLDAIKYNYEQIRLGLKENVRLLGVVKADAYGLGALEVAHTLEKLGVEMLGVTTIQEGSGLRKGHIAVPILVFGPFLPEDVKTILEDELTVTLANYESLNWLKKALSESKKTVRVHLKVETGMGRLGFRPDQVVEIAQEIQKTERLVLEGVYTHLATAMWKDKSYVLQQWALYQAAVKNLADAGITGFIRHIANSAAYCSHPQLQLDMVRIGTLLYGQHPAPWMEGSIALQDPWSFKARVAYLRELPAGHTVGYGRTYKTVRPSRIAVLPVGLADGFQVEPVLKPVGFWEMVKGMIKVFLQYLGHPRVCPLVCFAHGKGKVVGKIGMQLTMVDVTDLTGVEIGTTMDVPIRRISVNSAVPRLYIEDHQPKSVRTGTYHVRVVSDLAIPDKNILSEEKAGNIR